MTFLLFFFGAAVAAGLFFITADLVKLPRLDNPLETVRDQWLEENGSNMAHDEDVSHAIWSVIAHGESVQRGPELC